MPRALYCVKHSWQCFNIYINVSYDTYVWMYIFIENPYYRILTNHTIYAPLASSPEISVIVAIDSDGTESQQDDVVTDSLLLARPDDENFIEVFFEQDPTSYQLYHYMFPPLQRKNMGQYIIYAGTITITLPTHTLICYIFFRSK